MNLKENVEQYMHGRVRRDEREGRNVVIEIQSQSPEKLHSATAQSRNRVPQSKVRPSPGVLQRRGRKNWRSRRCQGHQENTATESTHQD